MNSNLRLKTRVIINKKFFGILICMLFIIPLLSSNIISATDNWSMFRHDTLHTGYSSSTAPTTSNVLWTFSTNDDVFSSPTIVDGKLYIGSDDKKIHCLDAEDGHEIWNSSVGGEVWESSPAVANDMVFIGGGNTFYCFNAENGSTIWSYQTGGSIRSSPVVVNDRVYIGSWDKKVYCFDADTSDGEDEGYDDLLEPPIVNYDLIWIFETGNLVDCSPAVYDNKVFIGSNDKKLYCLNAINGSEIWNFATNGNVFSSPAIADDKVYIGSYDHKVYCVDITTGLENWSFTTGDRVASSPAIHDGKVYVGSNDDNVYCLDTLTGSIIWDTPFETGENVFSSPAIADNKVYIGSGDNKLYCLYSNNGTKIWEHATGGPVSSSPAVYDGKIYVGSLDNKVYCVGDIYVTNQPPNTPTEPIGPREGKVNEEYTFVTSTTDPEMEQIQYGWDWNGDLTIDEWTSFYNSGEVVQASHTWTNEGTYNIRVKAKDSNGADSSLSDLLPIQITIEQPETDIGWIYGFILDDSGHVIEEAKVCAISTDDSTSHCGFTDETGAYVIAVPPGVYNVEATKDGFETYTIQGITVDENLALGNDFILPEIVEYEPLPPSEEANEQMLRVALKNEKEKGTLGLELSLSESGNIITPYHDISVTNLEISDGTVTFNIAGEEQSIALLAIFIQRDILDITNVKVDVDGEPAVFGDLESIFSLPTEPTYGVLLTSEGGYLLMSTPLSEHTITITTLVEIISDITAIMLYFAFFTVAAVIFATVVVVFLVKFVYSKK